MSVTVGAGHVTEATDKALARLGDGDEAYIIASPNLAYGAAGHPPFVPPNSHVVYSVQITGVSSTEDGATVPATGPKELVNIVNLARRQVNDEDDEEKEQKSVVFVKASDEGLTDEMLAEAAKSMDLDATNN